MDLGHFGYEFTNPSQFELEARRVALDKTGYTAYTIPMVILLATKIFRNLVLLLPFAFSSSRRGRPSLVTRLYRRTSWILGTTITSTPEFGSVGVQIFAVLYAGVLGGVVVSSSGRDYLHLTKGFGQVAVSQLPWLYVLSIKSPTAERLGTVLTGLTHERLNVYHRLLGKIVHLLLGVHAVLYLNFFVAKGLLGKRMWDLDVQSGGTAFAAVNLLAVFALPVVRARWYFAGFYRVHVLVSAALVLLLWVHVPYTRIYVGQAGICWVASGILRRDSWSVGVDVVCTAGSPEGGQRLVEVTAKIQRDGPKRKWLDEYLPGMHGYLNQSGLGPKAPFTVIAVDKVITGGGDERVDVKMMARNLGGPTTKLFDHASKGEKHLTLKLEGPYGQAKEYMPGLLAAGREAGKILLVAGGVGATYSLPIYVALLKSRGFDTSGLKLIWVVQDMADIVWGLDILSGRCLNASVDVDVVMTRNGYQNKDAVAKYKQILNGLVVDSRGGRPDLTPVVNKFIGNDASSSDKTTVMVCGPFSLSQHLRSVVGKSVMQHGRQVDWYEEQFGFGGS